MVHGLEGDELVMADAMSTGLHYTLRSREYVKLDQKALHWKHVTFKDEEGNVLTGESVSGAFKETLSIISSKNGLGRCTRTLFRCAENNICPVSLRIKHYMRILNSTGKPPDPETQIYTLSSGKVLNRDSLSRRLRSLVDSCNMDSRMVASHSLRRGGASLWSASGMSDEAIQRRGRWESAAFRRYIHIHDEAMRPTLERAAKLIPRCELN